MSQFEPQVIVVANREPYRHERDADGQITVRRSSSGVVNAVEPLLRACSGVWVAHGSATADNAVPLERDGLYVPPSAPMYRLRRIWLSEAEEREYYDGFANSALWPLCHRTHVQPVFRGEDFATYKKVNARFADAVADEARDRAPVVLIQDYHFGLAPRYVRNRLPGAAIATFWHIPFPHWQTFTTCPSSRELLQGLLGSDVLGFQTPADCFNFVETVDRLIGAQIDPGEGAITYQGQRTVVRDYPASIECPGNWVNAPAVSVCRAQVRRELGLESDALVAVGVDRLDYTKGIEEKLLMIERLLEVQPELRGKLTLVQLVEPTRARLAAYRALRARVLQAADRINRRFSEGKYRPIVLIEAHHSSATITRHFRAADVCIVSSLHDGMNLVSKEFVASRDDEHGVLVLSEFAGAANELHDAVLINPYDLDGSADALTIALTMSADQQRQRMRRLRSVVELHNAHTWASEIFGDLLETRAASERVTRPSSSVAAASARPRFRVAAAATSSGTSW